MKTFFIKSILAILLFTGLCSFAFASNGSPIGGAVKKPGGGDDGCYFNYLEFSVSLTNLNLYLPDPNSSGIDYLPTGYPPMYLRYYIEGGPSGILPVNEFQLDQDLSQNSSGIQINTAIVKTSIFDFCDDCPNSENGVEFIYSAELVTPVINTNGTITYITYPACDYTGSQDIFSCKIYGSATGDCSDPNPVCNLGALTTSEGSMIFDCSIIFDHQNQDPDSPDNPDGFTDNDQELYIENTTSFQTNKINVSPNPFTQNFHIELGKNDEAQEITLFNASGQQVYSQKDPAIFEEQFIDINTSNLPKGVYFLSVKTATDIKTTKVIKQ